MQGSKLPNHTHRFERNEKWLPEVTAASPAMPTEHQNDLGTPLMMAMAQSAVLRCSGNTFPFTACTHSLAAVLESPWGWNLESFLTNWLRTRFGTWQTWSTSAFTSKGFTRMAPTVTCSNRRGRWRQSIFTSPLGKFKTRKLDALPFQGILGILAVGVTKVALCLACYWSTRMRTNRGRIFTEVCSLE